MIGIYKITNKLNNKAYIGQSIHCGKRLDEHCRGKQFIDEVIQSEGIENFTFEILKEVEKEKLNLWEDYYINKFNTLFPNGYNKRWNCSEQDRKNLFKIKEGSRQSFDFNEYLPFIIDNKKLAKMSYNDNLYLWLLLHSNYNDKNKKYYIDKNNIAYSLLSEELGYSRQTISKRFKQLLKESNSSDNPLIYEQSQHYILPVFENSYFIHKNIAKKLLKLNSSFHYDELIKTYIWIAQKFEKGEKNISFNDIILAFGHSKGNEQTYNRYKDILTTLQGAGLIKFRTDVTRTQGKYGKTLYVYQVNKKASQEWLDKNKEDNNE